MRWPFYVSFLSLFRTSSLKFELLPTGVPLCCSISLRDLPADAYRPTPWGIPSVRRVASSAPEQSDNHAKNSDNFLRAMKYTVI
ncbi:hypothetical protein Ppro_0010 [Pelobacter propionicus DSM 2379]|uniref:Uncharacterized protein n=1 Tax=Pelobacter propionicus (strain DSM 2379 / NBRC 103807 / OttBd1) TaxID=338966 RepID=A1AJY1_PELPD|nr:hypothetical protein Ppro_0010 [Pelobacter propionicus DSM 2379]